MVYLGSVDKRKRLSRDYLLVLKSGQTYRAEFILDGQNKRAFPKSCNNNNNNNNNIYLKSNIQSI